MNHNNVKLLMDHSLGESQNYHRPTGEELLEEYIYAQFWDILGIVKNISNKSLENIQLVADIYDPSNQLIDVVTGSPSFANFPPGEQSSFKIEFQTDNNNTVFDHFVVRAGVGSNQFGQLLGLLGNLTK